MAQASSTFSTSYLEEDPAAIAARKDRVLCDRLGVSGDWCIGPRVDAAWTRGTAIANDLLEQPV